MSALRSWVIGSDATCDVRIIGDPYVSGHHARVTAIGDDEFRVCDLGSTNGTRLTRNGRSQYEFDAVKVGGTDTPWLAGWTLWVGRKAIPRPA